MPKMRAVHVARPGGPLELIERPIPEPTPGTVRIKVQACGICHSDSLVKEGHMPGIQYPRVPGHEVIGLIDAVGGGSPPAGPAGRPAGAVGQPCLCGSGDPCGRADFSACQTGAKITVLSIDGGSADYMIAPYTALAIAPAELPSSDAAPLMCAG